MSIKRVFYSITDAIGLSDECVVCHRIHISAQRAFMCCPLDRNYWGYGRKAKPPYKCPVCGKTYEPPATAATETAKQYAAFRAFTCCERPENKDLRKMGYQQATHRGKPVRFGTKVIIGEDGHPYGAAPFRIVPDYGLVSTTPAVSCGGGTCPECHGTGRINGVHCDRCGGTGKLLV